MGVKQQNTFVNLGQNTVQDFPRCSSSLLFRQPCCSRKRTEPCCVGPLHPWGKMLLEGAQGAEAGICRQLAEGSHGGFFLCTASLMPRGAVTQHRNETQQPEATFVVCGFSWPDTSLTNGPKMLLSKAQVNKWS